MFAIIALAFSLSMDSFVVALAKGAGLTGAHGRVALKTGLIFGIVQTIMPCLGWLLGNAASPFMEKIGHWIAFILLAGVGLKMIWEAFAHQKGEEKSPKDSLFLLILMAFGTSLDALVVGLTLTFFNVNIFLIIAIIGFVTFGVVVIGVMMGRYIGALIGRAAEILGGLVLIGIGTQILLTHFAMI